eukprot:2901553-Amphidinium_carterae.1
MLRAANGTDDRRSHVGECIRHRMHKQVHERGGTYWRYFSTEGQGIGPSTLGTSRPHSSPPHMTAPNSFTSNFQSASVL